MRYLFLLLTILAAPLTGAAEDDASNIREVIALAYDKPSARVQTRPVTVVGDYAVASWQQGERGGRALLVKQKGKWSVQLCSGKALRTPEGLEASRVPSAVAEALSKRVVVAESALAEKERERFDSFGENISTHHPH